MNLPSASRFVHLAGLGQERDSACGAMTDECRQVGSAGPFGGLVERVDRVDGAASVTRPFHDDVSSRHACVEPKSVVDAMRQVPRTGPAREIAFKLQLAEEDAGGLCQMGQRGKTALRVVAGAAQEGDGIGDATPCYRGRTGVHVDRSDQERRTGHALQDTGTVVVPALEDRVRVEAGAHSAQSMAARTNGSTEGLSAR